MGTKKSQNEMEFGMRISTHSILKEINNGGEKNLLLSPLSLHIALNMLASGSTGRTLEQLLHFLQSDNTTHLNAQSSLLMELATGDSPTHDKGPLSVYQNPSISNGPTICLVNGIWVDKRFPLKSSFKQLAEDVYKANAQSVDFLNQCDQVRNEINSWAKEASKGHIDQLLPQGVFNGGEINLVLANALYFKGTWVDRFYAEYTKDEDFHLLNGEAFKVPFMKRSDTYNSYGSFEGFKLLKMQYNWANWKCKSYAIYIFLPDMNDGLQRLVEKFNSDPRFLLDTTRRHLESVRLNKLWLPKLKYEYALNASASMKELGLDLPFDAKKAEINGLVETSEVVYVSKAIQKSYIELNEEGTVATSVNAMYCPTAPMHCTEPSELDFVADRPFLFMVKEYGSDIVLFVGAALNPLA